MSHNHHHGTPNPDIRSVQIGRKQTKPLTLYPLSIADMTTLTELIRPQIEQEFAFLLNPETPGFNQLSTVGVGAAVGVKSILACTRVFQLHAGQILAMATDEEDREIRNGYKQNPLLDDITPVQLEHILTLIWEVNFASLGKRLQQGARILTAKILEGVLSLSKMPPPSSSTTTPDTDGNTSTSSPSPEAG